MYVDQCNRVNCLNYESKMKFYSSVIEENSFNQFELFRAVEKMLNLKAPPKLPSHDCATDLANRFADFFTEKVQAIRNGFVTSVNPADHQETTALIDPDCKLHSFTPTTADELTTLLARTWGKSCMLDPLPGKLMTDCSDTLLPVIVRTVNLSFEEAVVPAKFKQGVLTPKLKKPSLDNELFPSFRPISNLRFISKATEKVVAARLNSYLDDNNLHELLQSAYKQGNNAGKGAK